jgi:hypothetical protein
MTRFETPGPVTLKLALAAGQAELETDDVAYTEVELVALADDAATRTAIEEAQVGVRDRPDGGHEVYVELGRPKGRGFTFEGFGFSFGPGRGAKVGVRIRCPHGAAVECGSSSTDVRARGSFGDVSVKTASGDTYFEDVAGTFSANSASGDIGVSRARSSVTVNTASGDIELGAADGPVKANLVSGDLTVGTARSSLAAQTVSGDQEIGAISSGEVRLNSVSGDVRVGVVPGVKLWIDASSVSGDMRSELEVGDLPPADEGDVVQLRAKTVSGDVNIVRAVGQVSA